MSGEAWKTSFKLYVSHAIIGVGMNVEIADADLPRLSEAHAQVSEVHVLSKMRRWHLVGEQQWARREGSGGGRGAAAATNGYSPVDSVMNEGPKRFSLSDYQSKRGQAKPAETAGNSEQKSELEELHMLLGTGTAAGSASSGSINELPIVLRTPGASPEHNAGAVSEDDENEDGEDVDVDSHDPKTEHGRRNSSRRRRRRQSDRRGSKDDKSSRHRHSHHHRRHKRSSSPRSRSASRTRRRSQAGSFSCSRSRSSARSGSRRRRNRDSRRSPSQLSYRSPSPGDKISMRCVFPYEDGGIIIGLRGAHLTKLRQSVKTVDWRISNETNDRQDRVLIVKGTVRRIAEAFCVLAEHFISQGMHVDYPPQTRGRGTKEVDTSKPFIPIRLLIPHKTCGAIIGQKSETLINTRVKCEARRVYVYRERISDSRERVVEIVGTPNSIAKVIVVLGDQIARTLNSDQMESDPYIPERDGLRKFLSKQGVPRARVSLESMKSTGSENGHKSSDLPHKSRSSKRSRSISSSVSRSPSSDRSKSRSRSRQRGHGRERDRDHNRNKDYNRRHHRRRRRHRHSRSRSTSRSRSRSPSRSRKRKHGGNRRRSRDKSRNGKRTSRRHRNHRGRSRSESRESSICHTHSRSRSASASRSRSLSKSTRVSRRRKRSDKGTEHGDSRRHGSNTERLTVRSDDSGIEGAMAQDGGGVQGLNEDHLIDSTHAVNGDAGESGTQMSMLNTMMANSGDSYAYLNWNKPSTFDENRGDAATDDGSLGKAPFLDSAASNPY
ncbi:RNA binding protein, heterogenous nuclear RNP-K like protein [Coemansia sp. RSA 1365]|nr:RNA binding protein, heterogenous nuclear RNP-K like protein [Coemansia sp. RSA 1365]